LRAFLLGLLQEEWGALQAYRRTCEIIGEVPDSSIWSDNWAVTSVQQNVDRLEWFEVFDLLEELAAAHTRDSINEKLARCGLAYELIDESIWLLDAAGDALEISGAEYDAEPILSSGGFSPVLNQYKRALAAIHGRPADLEKAVSEALGALEAVAHIRTGEKDFGKAIELMFSGRPGAGALKQSLKQLYGWASQLPGARHGRHAEPDLDIHDALYAVRVVGVTIAYVGSEDF
jgi:hypothetical protein